MHGLNTVRKQELDASGMLWVQEIFSTFQGEGAHVGTPSIFIRLAGCNLTCEFCDTDFETAFQSPVNKMTATHILTIVNRMAVQYPGCNNIVITGGEPFRQNFIPLASKLIALGFTVEIETAGTLWINDFELIAQHCHVTVSPKTQKINKHIERVAAAYKYVVGVDNAPKGDHLVPMTHAGKPLPTPKFNQPIFIQPMDTDDPVIHGRNITAAVELIKQTGWRLSVQTHKYIGVE